MKILHITPATDGYEEVDLVANRISDSNHLALIERNGEKFMTGGILLEDCPEIRGILDGFPKKEQYHIAYKFRIEPFAKSYADLEDLA
jgi:hypothetical protein